MNDAEFDEIEIRVTPPNLVYSANDASRWFGSGILDKPIGDFFTGTFNRNLGARFAANSTGSIRVVVNDHIIPELEEYALIFDLFALGFVLFRRHWQKKRQSATATS